jgi:hypothetical protein
VAAKDPRMSKQGRAGKRKHVTLTVLQKVYIIRRLESDKSCSVVMALCYITSLTVYIRKGQKDALGFFMASIESVKDLLK